MVFAINAALRGSGDTRLPFWIMMGVGILNVIFSVTFVFADAPLGGWRIGGIAAGTVCGYGISMCALLFIMLRRRKKYSREEKTNPWKNSSRNAGNTMLRRCTSASPICGRTWACRSAS
ncbi:polysaccharide biosynthesis C-terminal domain-containing protein [Akkermansia massiliensis]